MRERGSRTIVPSSIGWFQVKMIHPAVGSPTTGPRPNVRQPSVKSSASDSECWFVTRTVGSSRERWPRAERAGVVAHVDDDTGPRLVLGVEILIELVERLLAHVDHVHVAELPAARPGDV